MGPRARDQWESRGTRMTDYRIHFLHGVGAASACRMEVIGEREKRKRGDRRSGYSPVTSH